jgi:hypothetical protein
MSIRGANRLVLLKNSAGLGNESEMTEKVYSTEAQRGKQKKGRTDNSNVET